MDLIDIDEPRQTVTTTITNASGSTKKIELLCRVDIGTEIDYMRNVGVLHHALREQVVYKHRHNSHRSALGGQREMTNVMQFDDAISETASKGRALLIGNGFSAEFFSYRNLLEKSSVERHPAIHKLFQAFDTVDFERVIDALTRAAVVEKAYGNIDHAAKLEQDAVKTRELLVDAINRAHPVDSNELNTKYASTAKFLEKFTKIFTLNYDLLLYWTVLTKSTNKFRDGFGLSENTSDGRFRGPFRSGA